MVNVTSVLADSCLLILIKRNNFHFLMTGTPPLIFSHASKSVEDVLIYILNKNTSQVVFTHLHDIIKMYTSIFSFSQKYHENKYKYQYQQTFVKVIGNTYYQQNAYLLPLHCSKLLFSEIMRSLCTEFMSGLKFKSFLNKQVQV